MDLDYPLFSIIAAPAIYSNLTGTGVDSYGVT